MGDQSRGSHLMKRREQAVLPGLTGQFRGRTTIWNGSDLSEAAGIILYFTRRDLKRSMCTTVSPPMRCHTLSCRRLIISAVWQATESRCFTGQTTGIRPITPIRAAQELRKELISAVIRKNIRKIIRDTSSSQKQKNRSAWKTGRMHHWCSRAAMVTITTAPASSRRSGQRKISQIPVRGATD